MRHQLLRTRDLTWSWDHRRRWMNKQTNAQATWNPPTLGTFFWRCMTKSGCECKTVARDRRQFDVGLKELTNIQEVKHFNFCCAVYRWQTERGVHFLHEHPGEASSWDLDCLKAARELPGVVEVRCDQRLNVLLVRWLSKEGVRERTIDAANWLDDIHE